MLASLVSTLALVVAKPVAPLELRFETPLAGDAAFGLTVRNVRTLGFVPGDLDAKTPNRGAAEFDGKQSLLTVANTPATAAAFADGPFTWEGFFFSPGDNAIETDGAIADRFISQFKDDKLGSTRLTLGLAKAKRGGFTSLCVALAGTDTRHFGKLQVSSDVWHHFALVFEPKAGAEPGLGKLAWYLDYKLCGEVALDGKDPRTTLEPLGKSPVAIGARNVTGDKVDRGFQGLLDELRFSARALQPAEFLRTTATAAPPRLVQTEIFAPLADELDALALAKSDAATHRPTETLAQESLGIVGLPTAFSLGGFVEPRRGRHGVRTARELTLPAGTYRLLVATTADAVLEVDGRPLIDARRATEHPLGAVSSDRRDYLADFTSDGRPHRWRLAAVVDYGDGAAKKPQVADSQPTAGDDVPRPIGRDEVIVGVARLDEKTGRATSWQTLGPDEAVSLDPYSWRACYGRTMAYWYSLDDARRTAALKRRDEFWRRRHEWARAEAEKWDEVKVPHAPHPIPLAGVPGRGDQTLAKKATNPIDAFLAAKMQSLGVKPAAIVDDATFLRRVTLDLTGRNPTLAEARAFFADERSDRRARLVDRLLASPEWADSWVGYWQDLLAENPSILKPTLNNSGPFRRWIHESFAANKPLDQFAAELILMQGSDDQGGTVGFEMASGNDLPMAMKGHVLAQAFLGVDMKCARCHDAPNAPIEQSDLFSLAAMLGEQPLTVPQASTVVVPPGGRVPQVTSKLKAGDQVSPVWPLAEMIPPTAADEGVSLAQLVDRPRARLAAIITSPTKSRFSDVVVNRIWQRFFGLGLVEPVDHWLARSEASHPELLAYLSREFVRNGYDAKQLVRQMVTSDAYQRTADDDAPADASQRTFAAQSRRRMSAEQVVDSLFLAVGKQSGAEELNFDPNGTQGFLVLPAPQRGWQFASLSNERDRPALALPINQMVLDVLTTFGWRETRIDPLTRRDAETNPLQPLMMANSAIVNQAVRLTEEGAVTAWCLEDLTLDELVDRLFLATLARTPNAAERKLATDALAASFASRRTGKPKPPAVKKIVAHVDWDKHLKGEASLELMEAEKQARAGDPPTVRLTTEFRTAVEDVLWSLVNSPEYVFVP